MHQVQVGNPDIPIPIYTLQLLLGNPEMAQARDDALFIQLIMGQSQDLFSVGRAKKNPWRRRPGDILNRWNHLSWLLSM